QIVTRFCGFAGWAASSKISFNSGDLGGAADDKRGPPRLDQRHCNAVGGVPLPADSGQQKEIREWLWQHNGRRRAGRTHGRGSSRSSARGPCCAGPSSSSRVPPATTTSI